MRSDDFYAVDEGIFCLKIKNDSEEKQTIIRNHSLGFIQFHFLLKGKALFLFNEGNYKMPLDENFGLTLYNPKDALPIHLQLEPHSWLVSVVISAQRFHGLFSDEANFISFINTDKKHYAKDEITAPVMVVLHQILQFNLHQSVQKLFYKAKIYELFSLLLNTNEDVLLDKCPFINDDEQVQKIKQAKDIMVHQMTEPPTLQELADRVGINVKKLKEGFKQVYGDTVYGFLFEYKMDVAKKLLDMGTYNVNEVGNRVGYSTASHFISAFKKKYGTTPKKYLMSVTG